MFNTQIQFNTHSHTLMHSGTLANSLQHIKRYVWGLLNIETEDL